MWQYNFSNIDGNDYLEHREHRYIRKEKKKNGTWRYYYNDDARATSARNQNERLHGTDITWNYYHDGDGSLVEERTQNGKTARSVDMTSAKDRMSKSIADDYEARNRYLMSKGNTTSIESTNGVTFNLGKDGTVSSISPAAKKKGKSFLEKLFSKK